MWLSRLKPSVKARPGSKIRNVKHYPWCQMNQVLSPSNNSLYQLPRSLSQYFLPTNLRPPGPAPTRFLSSWCEDRPHEVEYSKAPNGPPQLLDYWRWTAKLKPWLVAGMGTDSMLYDCKLQRQTPVEHMVIHFYGLDISGDTSQSLHHLHWTPICGPYSEVKSSFNSSTAMCIRFHIRLWGVWINHLRLIESASYMSG